MNTRSRSVLVNPATPVRSRAAASLIMRLGVAVLLLGVLPLGVSGCARPSVSRLSPEARAEVVAIGREIDATALTTGVTTEVGSVEDIVVPAPGMGPGASGVPCRVYRPLGPAAMGTVVFVHGGAWVAGSVRSHDNMARLLCAAAHTNVVSVEYTRTPDAMYPTQLNEVRSVIRWLTLGSPYDAPLAICGDSAGGNMAAVLAREAPPGRFAIAVLINPVVDLTLSTLKDPEVRGFSQMMVNAYLPTNTDATDPGVSPLLSAVPPHHPPTFIAIGDTDVWRAEQDLYAEKLRAADVKLEVFRAPTGHLGPDGAAATPTAIPTLTAAAEAIKAAFGG